MNRKLCLVSEEVAKMIMEQLVHELQNYYLYNSFANFFAIEGIPALEEYYLKRAEEEREHHDWCFKYLNDADYRIIYPIIPELSDQKVTSIIDPFIRTINKEIETTQMIYKIYKHCSEIGDYMTCNWLDKYLIPEQIEEENTSRLAKGIMEVEGDIFLKSKEILNLLNK